MEELGALNSQIAAAAGVSESELYVNPIEINISGDSMGPISSTEDSFNVFPSWRGQTLDPKIYVHEVGHHIDNLFHVTDRMQTSFAETFADLTMFEVTQSRFVQVGPFSGFPPCLLMERNTTTANFFSSLGHLSGVDQTLSLQACCAEALQSPQTTLGAKKFCSKFEKGFDEMIPASLAGYNSSELEKPFRLQPCFNDQDYICDEHFLSEPINSFLLDLKDSTGLSPLREIIKLVRNGSVRDRFECEKSQPYHLDSISPSKLLMRLREILTSDQQSVFDSLWKSHGMQVMTDLFQQELQLSLPPECRRPDSKTK